MKSISTTLHKVHALQCNVKYLTTEKLVHNHASNPCFYLVELRCLGRFRSFLGRPRKSTSGRVAKNRLDRPRIDRLTRLVRTMCCEKYYYFMDVLNRTHRKLDYLDTIWYFIPLPLSFGQGASIHLKVARDMASYFPISFLFQCCQLWLFIAKWAIFRPVLAIRILKK